MSRKIDLVLNNQGDSYMLPFFWQHGETEEVLRDYMRAMQAAGTAVAFVDSRPEYAAGSEKDIPEGLLEKLCGIPVIRKADLPHLPRRQRS